MTPLHRAGTQSEPCDPVARLSGERRLLLYSQDLGALASVVVMLRSTVRVDAVSTQSAAQRLLADQTLGLAVIDLRAAVAAGMALIHVVRANRPDLTVVAVATSDTLVATRHSFAGLGVQIVVLNSDRLSSLLEAMAVATAMIGRPEMRLSALRTRTVNAIDYFCTHYVDVVHGRQLARLTNVSFFHLAHLFRADLGASIKEYMTSVRLEIARQLVVGSTDKMDRIAELTGFSDASHLSRVFREHLGQRPGQYRLLRYHDRAATSASSS